VLIFCNRNSKPVVISFEHIKFNQLKNNIMNGGILIPISMFLALFGIVYLYLSTRNKERLALIEKGADASIFMRGRSQTAPIWKVLILNLALLLMGIGLGIIIGGIIKENLNVDAEIAMPGTIFLFAGLALFIGFNMTKNLDKE
jgi:hypothetical protein